MIAAALGMGTAQGWTADLAHAATRGLIAAVWQGMLLSLLVAIGLRLLPKTPAAVRFAIWFGVFAVVAALPLAGLSHRSDGATNGHAVWLTLNERWCVIVASVWVIASFVRAITLLLAILRVRSLWKRAMPFELTHEGIADADKPCGLVEFRESASPRRAQLCISDEVDRPTVIGFFSPKILIPAWLVQKLTVDELEQIVLHEAGHLSRADDWMNLLQKIALVVFPLNPALAWVERRLCFERELACDERVLETTGAPKAYAACLASLAEHRLGRRGLALALGALGRESELGRRVRRILGGGDRMRPMHARLVLGGAMLGLLGAAAGLERCPQVIGFAPNAGEVAVASEPAHLNYVARDAYRYQPVVFHSPSLHASAFSSHLAPMGRLRGATNLVRETKLTRRHGQLEAASTAMVDPPLQASLTKSANVEDLADPTATVRDQQAFASETSFENSHLPDVAAVGQGGDVAQLVVVTSWRRDDGARIVLTTLRRMGPVASGPDSSHASDHQPSLDQVHPYAAVPVRDGWLLIQL